VDNAWALFTERSQLLYRGSRDLLGHMGLQSFLCQGIGPLAVRPLLASIGTPYTVISVGFQGQYEIQFYIGNVNSDNAKFQLFDTLKPNILAVVGRL
jgi:hypothetical protein